MEIFEKMWVVSETTIVVLLDKSQFSSSENFLNIQEKMKTKI